MRRVMLGYLLQSAGRDLEGRALPKLNYIISPAREVAKG